MSVNFEPLYSQGTKKLLFVDPSASHLAWCIVQIDHDKKEASITACGMLWTKPSWSRGQRFKYMQRATDVLINDSGEPLDGAVTEAFFANPKLMFGSSVVPTVNAFVEMAVTERNLPYIEIGPSSWRSVLGIKAKKTRVLEKGRWKMKNDYKEPAKNYTEAILGPVPEQVISNVTLKPRDLPSDITDCLCIALAYCKHTGIEKVTQAPDAFNKYSLVESLNKLAKNI